MGWYAFVKPYEEYIGITEHVLVERLEEQLRIKAMFEYAPYDPPAGVCRDKPLELATLINDLVATRRLDRVCMQLKFDENLRRRWLEEILKLFYRIPTWRTWQTFENRKNPVPLPSIDFLEECYS